MKSQVLHTVWWYISGEAAGEIWKWSLLEVKGLNFFCEPMLHNLTGVATWEVWESFTTSLLLFSDPYVKVSMIINGKTIKKRKTITLKKNSNPVFNEAFSFTITPSCLERVSFVIAAYTAPRLGGSKKMIGRAVTGPSLYSTGPGLAHWNDMLSAPRSAVAHWHNLI